MTEQTISQLDALSSAPSLSIFAYFEGNGRISISGSANGFANGAEVAILLLDTQGNSTALTVTVEDGAFVALNLDDRVFTPGILTVMASAGDVMTQQTLELAAKPDFDPIVIDEQPVLNALNQLSIQGKAPSLEPGDEVQLVIRDVNGTSVSATAAVQSDGRFSVQDISTQGLMDGTLFIDVTAQTDNGAISVMNAANVELVTQTPEGADRTLALNEDTSLALTVADFGYDNSDGFNLTGIKIAGLPSTGRLQLNGQDLVMDDFVSVAQLNAGQLVYRPPLNVNGNGLTNFKFKVVDDRTVNNEDRVANTITFNVMPVNDAPVNAGLTAKTTPEDTPVVISGLSVSDADIGGGTLTVTLSLTQNTGTLGILTGTGVTQSASTSGGKLIYTLSGTLSAVNALLATPNAVTYNPAANFNGSTELTITGSDGTLSDADTVTITVNAVNDSPANTVPVTQTAIEDTAKAIIGLSVTDVDGNLLTAKLAVLNGTLGVSLAGGASISAGANNSATLTLSGTQAQINAALGTVSYLGNANYAGSDTLTMVSTDSAGTPLSDTDTVAITVTGVNDAPVLADTNLAASANNSGVAPVGAVGSLVSSFMGGVTDPDGVSVPKGMAITAVDTTKGKLYYSTNGGSTWTEVTQTLSNSNALLLGSDSDNRVFYRPNAGEALGSFNAFTIRAWDQTEGTEATLFNITATGGSTAFSTATDTVALQVNDGAPPILVSSNPSDNGFITALGNNIILNFNEAVTQGTGAIELFRANGILVQSFDVATSPSTTLNWNGSTLTINPSSNLSANTGYYIKIAPTAVKDLAGNAYAGITDNTTLNFSTLNSDGSVPVTIIPGPAGSYLGWSVSSAGDVNGDGLDDFIVGSPEETGFAGPWGGAAYVIYGNTTGVFPAMGGGTIAASAGFKIKSDNSAHFVGNDVTGIGDINGDGMADVLIGVRGLGEAYVIYGNATGTGATIAYDNDTGRIGALNAPAGGFKIVGPIDDKGNTNPSDDQPFGIFGRSVSGVGDVNGDGFSDFIVNTAGPSDVNGKSAAFVVYGGTQNGATLNLSSGTIDPSRGYKITTLGTNEQNRVSGAGDVNGDGLADIVFSDYADPTATQQADRLGRAIVIFSTPSGNAPVDPNTISGTNGFKISGYNLGQNFTEVTSVGDVNGDGLADLGLITSERLYVVFGKTSGTVVELSTFSASQGFTFETNPNSIFSSVSSAGDMNGDGLNDIIVGDAQAGDNQVFVVYGRSSGGSIITSTFDADIIAASDGFKIKGRSGTGLGRDVSNAGDVNGDGLADLIIGSPDSGGYSIILGGTQWLSSAVSGSGSVTGTAAAEVIIGSTGNDTLTGGGGVDRFYGGLGNDTIVLIANDVSNLANNTAAGPKVFVNGGGGYDTLRLSGGANLNLTGISNVGAMGLEENSRIESIERIDLATDTVANILTITARDVNDMAGFNLIRTGSMSADGKTWTNVSGTALAATTRFHQLVVDGTSSDELLLLAPGQWASVGIVNDGTYNYVVQQNSATQSQVIVRQGVVVTVDEAPILIGSNPSDNGFMMNVTNNITLTFSEAVKKGTGLIQLYKADGTLVQSFDAAATSTALTWSGNKLTINPDADLEFSTGYYLKIAPAAVKDLTGNAYLGITDNTSLNFTTADENGAIVVGAGYGGHSKLGYAVSGAGDVNGDGYGDYIVGADDNLGYAYVIYGNAQGVGADVSASTIAAGKGFQIKGQASSQLGFSVSGAGDVNSDGFDDLFVAAYTENNNEGASYVVYGGATGSHIDLSSGSIAANVGFKFRVDGTSTLTGYKVSSAGDVNGDGLVDFIWGAPNAHYEDDFYTFYGAGAAFVVYGNTTGMGLSLNGGTIAPSLGFKIIGQDKSWLGGSVHSAGDVNGDGFADVIVGADYGTELVSDKTAAYVVFGSSSGRTVDLRLGTIEASLGYKISSLDGGSFGEDVSSAGDVNGDGLADLIIGAPGDSFRGGAAYVVYGSSNGAPVQVANGTIAASQGFKIVGHTTLYSGNIIGSQLGSSVSNAGDVNGDGLADLIVSAIGTWGMYGATYVVYGNSSGTEVDLSDGTIAASQGFKLAGDYLTGFGVSVSAAGDVNGDGLGDLLVGEFEDNNRDGAYHLVLGGMQWITNAVNGTGTVTGTSASEAIVGSASNDTLTGGGGVDRFFAGKDDDTIVLTANDVSNLGNVAAGQTVKASVHGGSGYDTIRLSGGANLNLTGISNVGAMGLEENSRIESIERIDLVTDTAANTLTLSASDVNDMAGFNMIRTGSVSADGKTWTNVSGTALAATTRFHQLVVDGTASDQLLLLAPGSWADVGTVNDGTHNYVVHQNSATQSQVIVRQGVVVTVDEAPRLISSNPADDSYVTALDNDITLNFNEAVFQGVGTISLFTAAGTLVQSFNVANSNLVSGWSTNQLTINPTNNLVPGTSYYLLIGTAAVKDVVGNSYEGINNNTGLNFTTTNANGTFPVVNAYGGAYRVSNAGDVNADGYEDVIVANPSGDGAAYVVYGNAQGLAVDLAGGTIAADKGFKIVGVSGSFLGTSVSSAGDINGDGFADVLVGAVGLEFGQSGGTTSAEGAAYVVYGSATGSTVNLANFQANQGVVFIGQTGESLGRVSLAGDVNGDGLSDLLLGTISGGNEGSPGRAYLIYGQSSGMAHNFFVDPTLNPSQGMVLTGNADSGGARQVGWFPSSAGDFNGDGYADMIFPSYAHDDAYIILGGPNALLGQDVSSSTLGDPGYGPGGDLDSLVAIGRGIKLHGDVSGMGYKVHGLGDVNGDGLGDVALVSNAGSGNFNVRVVYGTNANVKNIYLSSTASPQGFRINSDAADSGLMEVSSAGDMNGDGLADILVSGRKLVNAQDWSYVVYGSSNASNLNLTNLTIAADRGFRLQGTALGNGHSTAGDFNGDGLSDLIFGNDDTGSYSVVMGGTQWVTGAVNGAGAFSGSASNEALIGSAGNDTLTGGGGVDRFFAGKGDDTIVLTASDVANLQSNTPAAVKASVDGGTGFNTLRLSGGANLDLNLITNVGAGGTEESSRIENISRIDLATDSAANVLKIAAKDVGDMTGFNQIRTGSPSEDGLTWTNLSGTPLSSVMRLKQLVIEGGSNDTVVLNTDEGVWTNVGSASNGSHTYTVYQNDDNHAQVLVRQGVTVRSQAPTLLWSSPADNDFVNTDQLGQDITLRFREVVVKGTGQIRLWNLTENALIESFDVATSSLVSGWNSNTLTLNPTANLLQGKQYTVLVSDYAVHNSAGVAYAGVEDWTTFNFNTQSNDGSYAVTESYLSAFSTRRTLVDVSSAGDFNGDGYDDLLVMAPGNSTEPTGFAYVVFGNAEGTGQHLNDLAGTLPPERGLKITGDFANLSGSVSSLGDINGDGFADVLMGSNSNNGKAYVVYGRANAASLNFSDGSIAASDGFKITGHSLSRLGGNVSNAGDFNGDGLNDFILGAWTSNAAGVTDSGSAYVIYGKTNGSSLNLAADGSIAAADGIRLTGAAFNAAGRSVSGAGDVNGDGLADVIVSANGSSTTSGGGGYVIFGGATGGDMTTLANNGMGLKITGASSGHRVGTVVSSLGDVNGDGFADVALSTGNTESTTAVYVVYGGATPAAVNLSTNGAIEASAGFRISAATSLGVTLNQVSSAGDVNGDGLADMIVGSRNGTAFVVYGNSTGADLSLNNATIEASRGFKLKYDTANTANTAISVSSAGDLNGDGLGDLVIGDQGAGANGSYKIVFGGTQWISNAVVGNGTVTGTAASEAILGSDDNDTLVGGGGADRFLAGKGDDTIVLTGSDYTNLINNTVNGVKASVQGGSGYDTIRLSGGMNLFLPSISNVGAMGLEENSRIERIERIDMATDTGINNLSLLSRDVRDMAGMNLIRTGSVSADGKTWTNVTGTALSATTKFHQLVVDGGSNDKLTLGTDLGFWTVAGTVSNGTHNYTVYQNTFGNAQVLVRSGVVVTNNDSVAPVVLDLNHDGELSYAKMLMDVNSDGVMDNTLWAGLQDGVLVWDEYRDGQVHNHSQYAFTLYGGNTDLEGLAAGFDTHRDGVFNAHDEKFGEFKVWQDSNQNGVSDAGEVRSLADWGVASINLVSDSVQRSPVEGVWEAGRSTATTTDGQTVLVADAAFAFRDATAQELAGQDLAQIVNEADVAQAIANSVSASMSNLYTLNMGLQLDLSHVLGHAAMPGMGQALGQVGAVSDQVLSLPLAEVLNMPATHGVHQLVLTGAAKDKLVLREGGLTDSGQFVQQAGHCHAISTGTYNSVDPWWIDQQMLSVQQAS